MNPVYQYMQKYSHIYIQREHFFPQKKECVLQPADSSSHHTEKKKKFWKSREQCWVVQKSLQEREKTCQEVSRVCYKNP